MLTQCRFVTGVLCLQTNSKHIRTKAVSIIATVSTLFDPPVQMSMAENEGDGGGSEEKMDVDDKDQDYSEVIKVSFHLKVWD